MAINQALAKKLGGTGGAPSKKTKVKKPMSKAAVAIVTAVVFLLLFAGVGVCLYMNVGGLAQKALVMLPEYKAATADVAKQKQALTDQQAKLEDSQTKVDSATKANDKAAAALKTQQDQLMADQKAFANQKQSAQAAADRKKAVVQIYSTLDASAAAAMLLKAPTNLEAVAILQLLPADTQTQIIAAIQKTDAKKAYDLTKLMMQ